jgi:hypothetical protein
MSGVQLTVSSASILSDVFSIEWGLRKLVLRECDLEEHVSGSAIHFTFVILYENTELEAHAPCPSNTRDIILSICRVEPTYKIFRI